VKLTVWIDSIGGAVSFSPLLVGVLSETRQQATAVEALKAAFSPLLVGVLSETRSQGQNPQAAHVLSVPYWSGCSVKHEYILVEYLDPSLFQSPTGRGAQ